MTKGHGRTTAEVVAAWTPWVILSVAVFTWGSQKGKTFLNALAIGGHKFTLLNFPVTAIHNMISRMPPVVLKPTPEPAVFTLNWLSRQEPAFFSPAFSPASSWAAVH